MNSLTVNYTNRMKRVFSLAVQEMENTNHSSLTPVHLLLGFLQEKTGVLGEIKLKASLDEVALRNCSEGSSNDESFFDEQLQLYVTADVKEVLEKASIYMQHYNQILVNEGHVLKALLTNATMNRFITEEQKQTMLNLGTTARDMITHLHGYTFPQKVNTLNIKKVTRADRENLLSFVEQCFSTEWKQTVESGIHTDHPPIYIACNDDGKVIGFAAFDVYQQKKGYFGPMGVVMDKRVRGIGYSLLHHCLRDMKDIGYEYAIIGGAGPMEFYEKACHAVVIPKNGL
ncbi:GNAT family N-acetyltransferase [Ornithinibacillus salinisoli]|uniref:GNAT family N-acetyltransferase n=1 Tax=Ornithinibacillus salinisoli TaxID=1848459 RepID=A0ABW4VW00_9BACI